MVVVVAKSWTIVAPTTATSPAGACQTEEEVMKILHWRRKKDDLLFRMHGMSLCVFCAELVTQPRMLYWTGTVL